MKVSHTIYNYLCNCGIENEEYLAIKKSAYVSNFKIWRLLHILITFVFGFLFVNSLFSELLSVNRVIYLIAFAYALLSSIFFLFILDQKSIIAQFWIYLTIAGLFLFGCLLTKNSFDHPATSFIVMLLITPMFMIDRPFYMGIELIVASAIFLIWMYYVKPSDIWFMDFVNVVTYSITGFFIHIISNSIRIKEFVLTRTINIQKDTDELTGLKNKGALTREINEYLVDSSKNKGILFVLDIDYFKSINDTYGHDVGDSTIKQLGVFLNNSFTKDEIVGRFGGDEFIIFIKDTDDENVAIDNAKKIVAEVQNAVVLPDEDKKISISIGIALYQGQEKNYSELFKKADVALYNIKATRTHHYEVYK